MKKHWLEKMKAEEYIGNESSDYNFKQFIYSK